ncbi:MAG: Histidine kinase [candidate division NC10 bacterium]|nr:Histidine kinase [candidate division NC10 bacterium]
MAQGHDRLRDELVSHFREKRDLLRRQWVQEMRAKGLLQGLTPREVERESMALYDSSVACVVCLETGKHEAGLANARFVAKQAVLGGMTAEQILDALLTLRDLFVRSLVKRYQGRMRRLARVLDVYSPSVNRLVALVALAFVDEREKASKGEVDRLRTLVKTGMILSAKLSLETVLQRIANMACKLVNARYAALGVLDGKGGLSRFITAGIDEKTKRAIGPLPVGKGILGVLVHEARPLRLKDLTKDPRAHGFPPNHPPMRSFLGVPVVSKGKVLGNLYLTEKQGAEEFGERDKALAVTLAAQAAIALENASLYEALRRSYDELKQSQQLLVRQEKLASLGRLAAGLAHELNNPLSSVAGFAEALQRRVGSDGVTQPSGLAEFQEYVTTIQQEVARAAAIVRRLLDFARQREPAFDLVDISTVVANAVSFVQRQASLANQRVVVDSFPERSQVYADAQMLQQVFLNLLTNALDAIEGGGEVRIEARRRREEGGRRLRQHWLDVVVSDTGSGISPEDLPKVFDPFFTTKEVGKGTGLGLAVCQSIVEQHQGSIEVHSDGLGEGTVVTVSLPLAEGGQEGR